MKALRSKFTQAVFLILLFTLLTSAMCNKEDEPAPKTKTTLLASGNWYFTAYTADPAIDYDGNGTLETDLLAVMQACQKDNYYAFRSDGSGEFNYGSQKCGNEPQSLPYTWSFIENETKLKLDNGNVYTVAELTDSKLQLVLGKAGVNSRVLSFSH